jgi:phenylacetate-coenzyme A ligase PaaK-like adenylate-forming protein
MDDTIISERVQIERKLFFLDLKENPRGRFLRITEDVKGRRDTIIIPSTGLHLFREALEKVIEDNDSHPYEGDPDYSE